MKKFLLISLFALNFLRSDAQCSATQVNFGGTCYILINGFPPNSSVLIYKTCPTYGLIALFNVNGSGSGSYTLSACNLLDGCGWVSDNSGGTCTVPINGVQALPIKLTSLSLIKGNNGNEFGFSAGNETVNAEYTLQKSYDGINFTNTTAIYKTLTNNINATVKHKLVDVDNSATIYYRIKTVELSGEVSYSSILKISNKKVQPSIFPNPAKDNVQLNVSSDFIKGTYSISDFNGKQILQGKINANTQQIDVSTLNKGIYVIKLNNNNENISLKLNKE